MASGLDPALELDSGALVYDSRRLGKRIDDALASEEVGTLVMVGFAMTAFVARQMTELVFVSGVLFFWYARRVQRSVGLVVRLPKSSGEIDPKELQPGTSKPKPAQGIFFLGNDDRTGEELWITDSQARTHMLVIGTTGSGKTEYLLSIAYNALVHASGMVYVDGKADSSLYAKIYSMARAMGRDDDVLVVNFQTGARDIYGAQPTKLSNTLNPFAAGSSGMLIEMIKGLMSTTDKDQWTAQAEAFVEALIKPLVYLRDVHGLLLDVSVVREYFVLEVLEELVWRSSEKYPGMAETGVLDGLRAYLLNKPGYSQDRYHKQSDQTKEQHGYITMQLIRTFSSLSDTYGYLMKTPLAEVDFVDVLLNRRILIVLLPALEKSPTELANLGRIVVASIKATMAKGLSPKLEGGWKEIIESRPTNSPSPFTCVFDEYGYYSVEGSAVMPAQGRSLGFSLVFAGQDLPAFEKGSKEEAKSILANTRIKLCGTLECVTTVEYFDNLAAKGLYTGTQQYETDPGSISPVSHRASPNVAVERIQRLDIQKMRDLPSGQWKFFYGKTLLTIRSFWANPKPVQQLRVNHFIKVARPSQLEIDLFRKSVDTFARAVTGEGGLRSFMDAIGSLADIQDIRDGFGLFPDAQPLHRAGMVLAYCAQTEARRAAAFVRLTESVRSPVGLPPDLDVVGRMARRGSELGRLGLIDEDVPQATPRGGAQIAPTSVDTLPYAVPQQDGRSIWSEVPGDGLYSAPFLEDEMPIQRVSLLGATRSESSDTTSVFGIDDAGLAELAASTLDDIASDAGGSPGSDDFAHEFAFAPPAGQGGLLDLAATWSGVAAIEKMTGASDSEAASTASIVVSDIALASTYPGVVPSSPPDIAALTELAKRVSLLLDAQSERSDG